METMPIDLGGDCEWFAVDACGQIGFFTSAGCPYVPKYYWTRLDLMVEFAGLFRSMPVVCGHTFVVEKESGVRYQDWIDASNKGLYGYDYDLYAQAGYMLMTAPTVPIRLGAGVTLWVRKPPFFPGVFGCESRTIEAPSVLEWKPQEGG